jgi:hypothetical protein
MHFQNTITSHGPGRVAGGKARRKMRELGGNGQYWFGMLRDAVADDREARGERPDLSDDEVLDWADAFYARTGAWPTYKSGLIPESPGDTWLLIEAALVFGLRGCSRGGTLPRFFAEHRGRYNRGNQDFSIKQILVWADAWHERTGNWPVYDSGFVPDAGGLRWSGLDAALRMGRGGLPGNSSLAKLLAAERGVFQHAQLSEEQILAWAETHRARTGRWPAANSGPISDAVDENWSHVNTSLEQGHRGLPGGSSIAQLLAKRRGSRNRARLPRLTIPQILAWADAFHTRTGRWPTVNSGAITEAPGETWSAVHFALVVGYRGMPRGGSLIRLFAQERGVHSKSHRPRMTIPEILRWADAHHDRYGSWPSHTSGSISDAPGETWNGVQRALYSGLRGLPGGSTLHRLLRDERGVPNSHDVVPFTVEGILAWADAHHSRTGDWPRIDSGPIPQSPGDSWANVNDALNRGLRGLKGHSSIAQLLAEERGRRHQFRAPNLTIGQILSWADAFRTRNGRWPNPKSGPIPEAPGETWVRVDHALRAGRRGLHGGLSLARLRDQERPAKQS